MLIFVNMDSRFTFSHSVVPPDATIVRGLKKMTNTDKEDCIFECITSKTIFRF